MENNEENQAQQPGQPVTQQQQSNVIGGSAGTQQASAGSQQPTRSGSFTNLRAYIDANRGQGEQMAQQVSTGIKKQQQEAQTGLQGSQQAFQQKVGQAGNVYGQAEQNLIGQVANAPEQVDVNRFTQLRTGQYTGPQNLSDIQEFAPAQQQASNLAQYGQALGSASGRQAILQETFERPTYSRGQQALDQLLVETSPEAKQNLIGLRSQLQQFPTVFEQAKASAYQLAADKAAQTEAAKQAAWQALGINQNTGEISGGALGKTKEELDAIMASLPAQKQQQYADYVNQKRAEQEALYNEKLNPYITQEQTQKALTANRNELSGTMKKYADLFAPRYGMGMEDYLSTLTPEEYAYQKTQPFTLPQDTDVPYQVQQYILAKEKMGGLTPEMFASQGQQSASNIMQQIREQGPNIDQYANFIAPELSYQTVANPEQAARINALYNLSGMGNTMITDPNRVGAYLNANPEFNKDIYNRDLAETLKRFTNYSLA
jgi:hypothetical protein